MTVANITNTNPASVASGATDAGNPTKTGAVYNSTLPTFTNGQRGDTQLTARGSTRVQSYGITYTGADGVVNTLLRQMPGEGTDGTGGLQVIAPYIFNGTTWDRLPGTAADGMLVSATGNGTTITVTLSLDTSAYAAGDLLADTQSVASASRKSGSLIRLDSVTVLDEDDQGFGLDLIFLNANNTLGTENSAPSVSDANARAIVGTVSVLASDFIDMGGCRVACPNFTPRLMATTGGTTLYMGAVARGAGTYTASGIQVILGFTWF